jgi:hypothetical protein
MAWFAYLADPPAWRDLSEDNGRIDRRGPRDIVAESWSSPAPHRQEAGIVHCFSHFCAHICTGSHGLLVGELAEIGSLRSPDSHARKTHCQISIKPL